MDTASRARPRAAALGHGSTATLVPAVAASLAASLATLWLASGCGGDDDGPPPEDCATSLCGCPTAARVEVSSAVTEVDGTPVGGVEVYCDIETAPVATTATDGTFSLAVDTQETPGCGLERCRQLRFEVPGGDRPPGQATLEDARAGPIVLPPVSPPADGGGTDGGEPTDGGGPEDDGGPADGGPAVDGGA